MYVEIFCRQIFMWLRFFADIDSYGVLVDRSAQPLDDLFFGRTPVGELQFLALARISAVNPSCISPSPIIDSLITRLDPIFICHLLSLLVRDSHSRPGLSDRQLSHARL